MNFLQSWALLELQKRVDHLLAVVEDRPQILPTSVSGTNDVPQRNRLARQFGRNRSTEKAVPVKDTNFSHTAWIEANRDLFADVCRKSERQVSETLEVNTIPAHFASTHFLHEQEIELLE